MATGSIPPSSSISSFQATRSKVGPFVALGGVVAAAWFMKQSYEGNHDIWEQKAADHHTQAEYDYLREGWGHDSGHPFFDHLEHKMKGLLFFGPNGLLTHYHEAQTHGKGFRNDVIYANLFPISLAIASIYLGFGSKAVHGFIGKMFRAIKPAKAPPPVPGDGHINDLPIGEAAPANHGAATSRAGRVAEGSAKAIGKGFGALAKPFRGGYAPFTLIGIGFLLYAIHTFRRVWHHTAQEDRFRGFIHGADH